MNLKNKKVLVTGACGFIGSHLVEYVLNEQCQTRAFVFYNPLNSWGWLESLPKEKLENLDIHAGDIRNFDSVKKAVKDIDIVFHLAALIGIPYSYASPQAYLDTNVYGTLNILQASRDYKVERVMITSTSEVYGTAQYVPMDEKHPLQAQSPYAASKIAADKLAESFYMSFNTPITIVRPFNTYGPRQSARAIIPTLISQIVSTQEKISIGSIHPQRDFNYVDDVCTAFCEIAKNDQTIGKTINVCSGREISIGNLISLVMDLCYSKKSIIEDPLRKRPLKSEVDRLLGDHSELSSLTSWKPTYTLKEGLRNTIEWFRQKENLLKYKPDLYHI